LINLKIVSATFRIGGAIASFSTPLGRMGQFGAAVSTMDVSAMKCEMYFPLECHQSAKVSTAVVKRVGARFGLALVPIVQQ